MDNSSNFMGSFAQFCKGLGIVHHHITVGNSKANGQVEKMIKTLQNCIWCSLIKEPASFWTNHFAPALLLLCMTVSQVMGVVSFFLAMGCQL